MSGKIRPSLPENPLLLSALAMSLMALIILPGLANAAVRPPSLRVDAPTDYDPEELVIAINPTNPDMLIAGANQWHVFASYDGGLSWTSTILESTMGVVGDPCVIFDADGIAYYSHLSISDWDDMDSWLDRIVVQRSPDGGLSWSDGSYAGLNPPLDQDKSWMVADRTMSPQRGNLYLAWTEFDAYGTSNQDYHSRILFSRSLDQGLSWNTPLQISDLEGDCIDDDQTVEGAVPTAGPEGQVYVAWSYDEGIWFDRSFDGGETFGSDVYVTDQPGGWTFEIPGVYRCNGMPVTACDVSDSPFRGRVYVLFSDQRNGISDTDVFLCRSDDMGETWSNPIRVNDDTSGVAHQFFPWLVVDPTTGYLHVVFYDRRQQTSNGTDVYLATSTDGGDTFVNNMISDTPFTPTNDVFMGDYIGIDAYEGIVHAIWTRLEDGELSVWTSRIESGATPVHPGKGPKPKSVRLSLAAVNPTGPDARISFTLYQAADVQLTIHDVRGRLLRTLATGSRGSGKYKVLWDGKDSAGRRVPSGVYLCHLQAGPHAANGKVTIVR